MDDGAGNHVQEAADDLTLFDERRSIMDRRHEARARNDLFDRGFILTLRRAVIAGDARLHVANLTEGFDELVIDIVDQIAAD